MNKETIRDYRDLLVWQKSMDLAALCEGICDKLPTRAANLAAQIRRSAQSVPANIAEGNGRFSRADYVRHLSIANGSLRELESHLQFALRAFGEIEGIQEALGLASTVAKLLAGLVRSLKGKRPLAV